MLREGVVVVGDSLPLVAIAAEGRESENMHVSDCGNENTGSYILTMQSTLSYISILHGFEQKQDSLLPTVTIKKPSSACVLHAINSTS